MKYKGTIGFGETYGNVTDSTISDEKLAVDIDLIDDGPGFMKLISTDGKTYSGTFQYNNMTNPSADVVGRLYHDDDDYGFIGTWIESLVKWHFSIQFVPFSAE